MEVFVAGATGVLGRRLIAQFKSRGHRVVGLVRRPENERVIASLGGEPKPGDLFDVDSLVKIAQGADVVIHAATAIPTKVKIRAEDWAMNDRIRREGTHALTECAGRIGAGMYLQQSVVWVAQPEDGSAFDESSPVTARMWYASAADSEEIARTAGERHGFDTAVLRCGGFYAPDSAQTRMMGERLLRRRMPIVGQGEAVWANIHADDAASAFVAAAEAGMGGLWHVVDDRPATIAEFMIAFSRILGAPRPRHIPGWLARVAVGEGVVTFFEASTRTTNAKIRRDLDWAPRYPSYENGLHAVVDAWKAEGFSQR